MSPLLYGETYCFYQGGCLSVHLAVCNKSYLLHNFAVPAGIWMKLSTVVHLINLKCRTQVSAMSLCGQGHGEVNGQMVIFCVRSITLQCLMGFGSNLVQMLIL